MLHFLGLYTSGETIANTPPTQEQMEKMRRFVQQAMQAGWLVQTGPLLRGANGARVTLANGSYTVADGVSPERREMGFALLRADTKAEMVEHTKHFLHAAGGGAAELIEIMAPPPECGAGA